MRIIILVDKNSEIPFRTMNKYFCNKYINLHDF